jgi:hypothetical protein
MKRSTKPPAPLQNENPPSARPRKVVQYDVDPAAPSFPVPSSSPLRVPPPPQPPVPPPLPSARGGGGEGGRISAIPALPLPAPTHSRDAETVSLTNQEIPPEARAHAASGPRSFEAHHRPPHATIPLTPAIEWEPAGSSLPTRGSAPPSPPLPRPDAPSTRSMESDLRQQIMSGMSDHLATPGAAARREGERISGVPSQNARGAAGPSAAGPGGGLPDGWSGSPSDSYPSAASGYRESAVSRATTGSGQSSARRSQPDADQMPLGYAVASAFFLAVAVVGFGLWLAFEVF